MAAIGSRRVIRIFVFACCDTVLHLLAPLRVCSRNEPVLVVRPTEGPLSQPSNLTAALTFCRKNMNRAASLRWLEHDVRTVFDKACSLASNLSAPALSWNNVGYKHISPCTSLLSTHIEEKHFWLMHHIAEALRKEWQKKQQVKDKQTALWKFTKIARLRVGC